MPNSLSSLRNPRTTKKTASSSTFTRRTLLSATGAGLTSLALSACRGGSTSSAPSGTATTTTPPTATPKGLVAAIRQREAGRPHTGATRAYTLRPRATEIDLGGPVVRTLAYGDTIPGPVIRANLGNELAVRVHNQLDQATSVHWHGIALRNDMAGATPATPNIRAGAAFTYRFSVPDPGTFWAHPHVGTAITDYGLYLPVIVDDPNEPGDYDTEWIVVLDDWTDGVGPSPKQILAKLQNGGKQAMSGMDMPSTGAGSPTPNPSGMSSSSGMGGMGNGSGGSDLLGGDAGDVTYPYYLVNGRIPSAPTTFRAKPGQRIRIRIINAGADTAFRVALAGHRMTVTHTDGFPVEPVEVDALLLGMGERYDVVVPPEMAPSPWWPSRRARRAPPEPCYAPARAASHRRRCDRRSYTAGWPRSKG